MFYDLSTNGTWITLEMTPHRHTFRGRIFFSFVSCIDWKGGKFESIYFPLSQSLFYAHLSSDLRLSSLSLFYFFLLFLCVLWTDACKQKKYAFAFLDPLKKKTFFQKMYIQYQPYDDFKKQNKQNQTKKQNINR